MFRKVGWQGLNIVKIQKSDFDAVLRLDGTPIVIVDEQRFAQAHKMFEKEMLLKSDGIPFTDFNHPHLLKDEINYKRQIIEKTMHIRSAKNLNQWIKTRGILLEKLRDACSQKISVNLLMGAKYGTESGSASSLELVPKNLESDYEQILYEFFTAASSSQDKFGEKFDQLISFLQKNNLNLNWRILTYLAFIANPDKYFPIQTTSFEKLLQFYGNQYKLRANFSWKQYSIILELADILRSKLAKYGKLDPIQIQSYMWVVSKLIENIPQSSTESEYMSSGISTKFAEYEKTLLIKNQVIFYGPPGTGKTFTAKEFAKYFIRNNSSTPKLLDEIQLKNSQQVSEAPDFIRMVTFHPSYSYEDFIEGIRPRQNDTQITYTIEPGIFRMICEDAKADPNNRYVLLIDEINRGNISKIFGELITLIENNKRGKDLLHLTYSKELFTVPKNLFIIGTMNTADRSLTQLDVALRRRFGFIELMPNYDIIQTKINEIPLATLLKNLNSKIMQHVGREKQIGHSYFMENQKPIQKIEELQFVFVNEIIPLLQDYFYEDYEKLHQVLGNDFVDAKNMEIRSEWQNNTTLFETALKPLL